MQGSRFCAGDLLRAQVLLDRHRVVGAALDRRVVGDDHALAPRDPADPGDDPGPRGLVVVHAVRGQRRQLQKRTPRIEQAVDPVARQQFAAADVTFARAFLATQRGRGQLAAQLRDKRAVRFAVFGRRGHRVHANFG